MANPGEHDDSVWIDVLLFILVLLGVVAHRIKARREDEEC